MTGIYFYPFSNIGHRMNLFYLARIIFYYYFERYYFLYFIFDWLKKHSIKFLIAPIRIL